MRTIPSRLGYLLAAAVMLAACGGETGVTPSADPSFSISGGKAPVEMRWSKVCTPGDFLACVSTSINIENYVATTPVGPRDATRIIVRLSNLEGLPGASASGPYGIRGVSFSGLSVDAPILAGNFGPGVLEGTGALGLLLVSESHYLGGDVLFAGTHTGGLYLWGCSGAASWFVRWDDWDEETDVHAYTCGGRIVMTFEFLGTFSLTPHTGVGLQGALESGLFFCGIPGRTIHPA